MWDLVVCDYVNVSDPRQIGSNAAKAVSEAKCHNFSLQHACSCTAPQLVLLSEAVFTDRIVVALGQIILNGFITGFTRSFPPRCIGWRRRRRRRFHLVLPQLEFALLNRVAAVDPRVSARENVTQLR